MDGLQSLRVSDELADSAESYLAETPEALWMLQEDAARWVATEAVNVTLASRQQHFRALAFAYALFVRSIRDHDFRNQILPRFAAICGRKITRRVDPLRIIVEATVSYGAATDRERARTRGLYSRDVQAIRYLQTKGVKPADVERLSAEKGEGLDSWSRRYSAAIKEFEPKEEDALVSTIQASSVKRRIVSNEELDFMVLCMNKLLPSKNSFKTQRLSPAQEKIIDETADIMLRNAQEFLKN